MKISSNLIYHLKEIEKEEQSPKSQKEWNNVDQKGNRDQRKQYKRSMKSRAVIIFKDTKNWQTFNQAHQEEKRPRQTK